MKLSFSSRFTKQLLNYCKKNEQLRQKFSKQIKLFENNPVHPSLKLHKLKGKRSTQFAIWIAPNIRALCAKREDEYVFSEIVTHDEY